MGNNIEDTLNQYNITLLTRQIKLSTAILTFPLFLAVDCPTKDAW